MSECRLPTDGFPGDTEGQCPHRGRYMLLCPRIPPHTHSRMRTHTHTHTHTLTSRYKLSNSSTSHTTCTCTTCLHVHAYTCTHIHVHSNSGGQAHATTYSMPCSSLPLFCFDPSPPLQDLLSTEAPERAATEVICLAHQHELACISINQKGTLIATASSKVSLLPYLW